MTTIHDVAKQAGVSIATVSYVLHDKRRVSSAATRRVKLAVKELNYTPNGTARKLKKGRTSIIGFVADNISNRFPACVVHGVAGAAAQHGYNVLISDLHDEPSNEKTALELLVREQVDGLIYCGFGATESQLLRIHQSGMPVVVMDKPPRSKRLPAVLVDNKKSIEALLEHLKALGHRTFRFISGDANNRNTALRNAAFLSFMKNHRLPSSAPDIVTGAYSIEHGYASALKLHQERPGFSAVVCGDDMIAFGAMAGLKSCGLRIPEDVAVVGFMDDPLAVVADPGLTTIHHPMVHMGRRAFEFFLSLLNEPQQTAPREILNTQLIIRRSTDVTRPIYANVGSFAP